MKNSAGKQFIGKIIIISLIVDSYNITTHEAVNENYFGILVPAGNVYDQNDEVSSLILPYVDKIQFFFSFFFLVKQPTSGIANYVCPCKLHYIALIRKAKNTADIPRQSTTVITCL